VTAGAGPEHNPLPLQYHASFARVVAMPSFDIVSELNAHEVANAIDQANREVGTRFDFKGTNAKYELKEFVVTSSAPTDFQLQQMLDILKLKLSKRGVDVACMKVDEPVITGQTARQVATLRQGIDTELGKKIQRLIKDSKLKVQAAIQDKQVRVSGKSRDELQEAIALVRRSKLELPLQFTNFRD
jgi:cyclic-di-GMP-binding protein